MVCSNGEDSDRTMHMLSMIKVFPACKNNLHFRVNVFHENKNIYNM